MKTPKETPWIIWHTPSASVLCERCKFGTALKMPIPVAILCKKMAAFITLHEDCEEWKRAEGFDEGAK
jgi:hypothetical protein